MKASVQKTSTQRAQLLELLRTNSPNWVLIGEVVSIAGFQYGARILELRRLGHRIENNPGRAFRLVPSSPFKPSVASTPVASFTSSSLFGELQPELRHRDDG